MQLFIDNDIILKLSSIDRLKDIESIFNVEPDSVFILPSAEPYIRYNKKLLKKYDQKTIDSALTTISRYKVISTEIDKDYFEILSDRENIDSGEQILFSIKPSATDYLILTGDKKSLIELESNAELVSVKENLKNRIVCFEYLMQQMINLVDFNELTNSICENNYCGDKVLYIIFRQSNLTTKLALEGLNSYYNDLKTQTGELLKTAELINS